jgi:preprotein translocase subunit SecF
MTDTTDSTLDADRDLAAAVASNVPGAQTLLPHARRSRWGRLYHGETSIDFWGRRRVGFIFSGVLIVLTVVSLFAQGLNLGIDFEGGVAWEVPANGQSIDSVRAILEAEGLSGNDAKIQVLTSADSGERLRIQVGDQPQDVVATVQQALADGAKVDINEVSTTSVSSSWGRSITEKAVRALVIFLVLVMLYISWRFQWRMALAAIVAMLHDVFISVGIYSLFGFEVTPATVVSFLTILGFSLYDTIVVFDKINENTERYAGTRLGQPDIMNVSMNQVLMRSINTSLAAVLPVLSLLLVGSVAFGAVALREFALALLIGLLIGSYSSIFVAAPLFVIFKQRDTRNRSTQGEHVVGAELERLVLGGSPEGHRRELARARSRAAEGVDPGTIAASSTPESVLTHPPRPRKKKRR